MLVINRKDSAGHPAAADERGAALLLVVMVAFIGLMIVATIVGAVFFTAGANAKNRDRTIALIAAESGRDVAYASLKSGCSATTISGADPQYTATIYAVSGTEPTTSQGLTAACPSAASDFVVVHSTGTAPDGSKAEIDAVYPWRKTFEDQPGGTVAFFDGTFTTTKSGYKGDLVVRDPHALYWCNNSGTIEGDLYVVDGNARFSGGCTVTGSVYVNGTVELDSSGTKIGGDIIASGDIDLVSDGNSVGGNIHSGGDVYLKNTGSTGTVGKAGVAGTGDVKAAGTAVIENKWTITGTKQEGVAAPVFSPSMATVYGMTTWLDMTTQNWGAAQTVAGSCAKDYNPIGLLDDATTSLMIDFTACKSGDIDIKLGGGKVTRDVVFAVPANLKMKVALTGNVTANAGTNPQIAFVHADSSLSSVGGEKVPSCGNNPQKDSFDVATGITVAARVMIYTPCGLTGNVASSFSGQFYTANDGNHTISATFTCVPMSWPPVFPQLGCKIKSSAPGDGGASTVVVQSVGERIYQAEK